MFCFTLLCFALLCFALHYSASHRYLPASHRYLPASHRYLPASHRYLPASHRLILGPRGRLAPRSAAQSNTPMTSWQRCCSSQPGYWQLINSVFSLFGVHAQVSLKFAESRPVGLVPKHRDTLLRPHKKWLVSSCAVRANCQYGPKRLPSHPSV